MACNGIIIVVLIKRFPPVLSLREEAMWLKRRREES